MPRTFLGVEIGGTKLQLVAGDGSGRILERRRFHVARDAGADGIRAQLAESLPPLARKWQPAAVGAGFGGPVDWRTGRVSRSHQIPGWSEFDLGGWLAQLAEAPARVENDANTAALAEARLGAGAGLNPVFYVTLGSGVGGGLVVDGRVYHGAAPGESEIGHVRLDRSGALVEERCSGWAVDRRIRQLKESGAASVLCDWMNDTPGNEARLLGKALAQRDAAAQAILDEVAGDLAFALSHVVHLFHPQVIVLGGGLSLTGEPLRAAVARASEAGVMEVFRGTVQVRLAKLQEDAVPAGALLLAAEERT
jgi:glucokinase